MAEIRRQQTCSTLTTAILLAARESAAALVVEEAKEIRAKTEEGPRRRRPKHVELAPQARDLLAVADAVAPKAAETMRKDAMVGWRVYGLECELLRRQQHGGSLAEDVVLRVGVMCHTAT